MYHDDKTWVVLNLWNVNDGLMRVKETQDTGFVSCRATTGSAPETTLIHQHATLFKKRSSNLRLKTIPVFKTRRESAILTTTTERKIGNNYK